MKTRIGAILALIITGTAGSAGADDEVRRIFTHIDIAPSGRAVVTHAITVIAEGNTLKHGIYFRIPRSMGPLSDLRVSRDGLREPFRFSSGVLQIGDEDVELHGSHSYRIRYQAARPFRRDEAGNLILSWTPLVAQFDLPWHEIRFSVAWPSTMGPDHISGPERGIRTERSYEWRTDITRSLTRPVKEISFVLHWPADTFPDASIYEEVPNWPLRWTAAAAILVILIYFHLIWLLRGRDAEPGPLRPQPEPPLGLSPAATRYVQQMGFDATCLLAALLSLKTKGLVEIESVADDKLTVRRTAAAVQALPPGERALLGRVFAEDREVTFGGTPGSLGRAMSALRSALQREYREKYFRTNRGVWLFGLVVVAGALAVLLPQLMAELRAFDRDLVAVLAAALAIGAAVLIPLIYYTFMRAPTRAGRGLMDRIAGLRLFLTDASSLPDHAATAEDFVRLLPYAVALDAEEEWAARFANVDTAADATDLGAVMEWYRAFLETQTKATITAAVMPAILAASGVTSGAAGTARPAAGGW